MADGMTRIQEMKISTVIPARRRNWSGKYWYIKIWNGTTWKETPEHIPNDTLAAFAKVLMTRRENSKRGRKRNRSYYSRMA